VKAEINVTPLVDIVLVLLIIFIVITPAVNNAVRLPVASSGSRREGTGARPLTLVLAARRDAAGAVREGAVVRVEGRDDAGAMDLADPAARARLTALLQGAAGGPPVLIKADHDLPFARVNDLLLLCRGAGALEASVVTRERRAPGA